MMLQSLAGAMLGALVAGWSCKRQHCIERCATGAAGLEAVSLLLTRLSTTAMPRCAISVSDTTVMPSKQTCQDWASLKIRAGAGKVLLGIRP